jgi:hypothetical protein
MEPSRIRITLSRHGNSAWRSLNKKDTVGSMIGFYIFVNSGGELTQIYESVFSPEPEITTDANFVLEQLHPNESYIIMPTTFSEAKIGSFVLSILSEYEFVLQKEK